MEIGGSPEALVEEMRKWLRPEYLRPFNAALEWGWPRCRTVEERHLFPCLLAALSPYNAIISPRRLSPGETVSFQISLSRPTEDRPERHGWRVVSTQEESSETGDEPMIFLPTSLVQMEPWSAALIVFAAVTHTLLSASL